MNTDNRSPKKNAQPAITPKVLDALRMGDHNAYAKVFLYYQASLENFLIKLTGSYEDAQDVFQKVLVSLWEKRERIDPTKNIKSYLFTMARNTALNDMRNKGKFENMESGYEYNITGELSADSELIVRETQLLLEIAVRNMPRQRQEIYRLHLEGHTYDEIAKKLEITQNNVQRQVSNARKELRELMSLILFFMIS